MKRAHIEAESLDGTPLQVAVSCGNAEAVKCLLSHGANVGKHNFQQFLFIVTFECG